MTTHSFHSLYSHGFVRVAVCVPTLEVANVGLTLFRLSNWRTWPHSITPRWRSSQN